MANDRIFNFNGANVTFNDIHDNDVVNVSSPGAVDASKIIEESSPDSTSDPEDLSDDKWVEIQKVFKGPRSIISILRAMIADCLKPADCACMIAVLDDFGLVRDRFDFAGISNALAILGRNVEPNSIRYKLNQLPSDFRSWDKTQFKSDYSFCSSLELHIKDIPGYTYRY